MHTWHIDPVFTVTPTDLPVRAGAPAFDADSQMALSLLASSIGPTSAVTLRTMAIAGRGGERDWHIADLATLHGVTPGIERKALDRLADRGWLIDTEPGHIALRRSGNLSAITIERLHPHLVEMYLRPNKRYPLAPLLQRAGADSIAGFARSIGVTRSLVQAAADRGLSERNADRFAIAAGLHPGEVWADYFDAATALKTSR